MSWDLALSLLARATLLLAAALVLDGLLRRRWVLVTAAMWNATLLAILILPLAMALAPRWPLNVLPPPPPLDAVAQSSVGTFRGAGGMIPAPARHSHAEPAFAELPHAASGRASSASTATTSTDGARARVAWLLAAVYSAGAIVALARLAAGWLAAAGLRCRAASVADPAWRDRLQAWQARLRVGRWPRPVQLLHSDRVDVPVALGVRDPAIVIPTTMASGLSPRTMDAVIAHELSHIARADYAWLLADRLAGAVLWFHPLLWIAVRRMAYVRERACDEYVVYALGDGHRYAETLLDLASRNAARRSLALGLAVVRPSNLARRLKALQDSKGSSRCNAPPFARLAMAAAALFATLLLAGVVVGRAAAEEPRETTAPAGATETADNAPTAQADNSRAGSPSANRDEQPARPTPESHPITVFGKAVDGDGAAVEGATVYLVSSGASPDSLLASAVTGADGRYEFLDVALPLSKWEQGDSCKQGYFEVFGSAPGRGFAWRGLKGLFIDMELEPDGSLPRSTREMGYVPGTPIELDLTFAVASGITGRFLDEAGEPVAGVTVRISHCDYLDVTGKESHVNFREFWALSQAIDLMPDQVSAVSDADGRFDLPAVPPDVICWLHIEHVDYARASFFTATTDAPPAMHDEHPVEKLPIEMTLRAVRSVPIEVRLSHNAALVPGVKIVATQMRATGNYSSGTSDEAGHLTLRLPPGEYQLDARQSAESSFLRTFQDIVVSESRDEQPMTMTLNAGCVLMFKALDADTGAGIAGVSFWYEQGDKRLRVQSNTTYVVYPSTDETGEFLAIVEPGQRRYGIGFGLPEGYELVEAADASAGRELDLPVGGTVTVEFKLRRADDTVAAPTDDAQANAPAECGRRAGCSDAADARADGFRQGARR